MTSVEESFLKKQLEILSKNRFKLFDLMDLVNSIRFLTIDPDDTKEKFTNEYLDIDIYSLLSSINNISTILKKDLDTLSNSLDCLEFNLENLKKIPNE